MKKIITFTLVIFGLMFSASAQDKPSKETMSKDKIQQGATQWQSQVKSLMDYFEEYDPLAPEPLRKAKFNDYVNEFNPSMSKLDREKAYTIVDAYIRADKGQDLTIDISEEDREIITDLLQDAEKKKHAGEKAMLGEFNRIKNMSYAEYKAFVTQNGQLPLDESEIRKAYNAMHKEDGKQVPISVPVTHEKMSQMKAIDILQNPKNYKEFRQAILTLKPDMPEEEIRKAWQKKK